MVEFSPVIRLDVAALGVALVALLVRQEVRLSVIESRLATLWQKCFDRPMKEKA
jgi:hypothetical protein